MIKSGSHHLGGMVDDFQTLAGMALRIERIVPGLQAKVADYVVLDSNPALFSDHPSWMLGS